ncbi:MAG: hypothetical protein A2351_05640 [Omnitrophica bacterium RIFOXYB12_FULL_50_7]|nr:MAG: hypothetical protein A2351_05640 [Omnitrophica bacterium RIFOXYB12_FULL_50_7]
MAVVLSNQEQLELFRNAKLTASSVKIYCDDEHFFAELQRKRIKYHPLNEFRLQPQWNDINAWGCQTACRWITASKEGGFFKTIDFASVFYLFFSHLLVQGLKNLHYARRIVENPDVRRVAVFDTVAPNVFPEFSGNGFLNYFLKQLAETKGKETIILRSVASARSELVRVPKSGWVKALVEKSYAFFVRPGCKPSLWVYGSLMHLESLLPELKRQKVPFFYYNQELNIDQLKFSIWHRIPYYIRSSFPEAQVLPSVDFVKEKSCEIHAALEHAAAKGLFIYQGFDLSDFVKTQIFGRIEETLQRYVPLMTDYDTVLREIPVTGLLTDEDYALRGGFLAAFLQSRNVKTYCVSHANTAVDFKIPEQDRAFGGSTTFVQSAYERDNYAARGWRPENFIVTGTPRYDRLSRFEKTGAPFFRRKLRLLYCTNSSVTEKHYPDNYGYLGQAIYSTEIVTRPAADASFEAIKGLPIELWLKPHNLENIGEWESYVTRSGALPQVKFLRKKTTILSYFADCDAMILSYWSSALIEAALAHMPVLFVDINNLGRPSLAAYESKGFCRIVKNAGQLRSEIESLCRSGSGVALQSSHDVEYYLGKADGMASFRVAKVIREMLHPKAEIL